MFDGSVSGLRTGATVLFNGIQVGEVTNSSSIRNGPRKFVAVISLDQPVAVRTDTEVGLDFQGLTGIAADLAQGRRAPSPAVAHNAAADSRRLPRRRHADVTQAARDVLRPIDDLVADNQKALHEALDNSKP